MKTSNIKAAGKKFTKRFKVPKDIQLLTTQIKKDLDVAKSIVQLMQEQIINDQHSSFKGHEIAYYVPISKRKRNTSEISTIAQSTMSAKPSSVVGDRYLILLIKPDSKSASFLKVIRQRNELEIKTVFNMRLAKSIDYGAIDLEIVLSLDSADYSIFFQNQQDRDECLWITVQLGKLIAGDDFSVSYSVDMEALTYMMTTSGAFDKFPALRKYMSINNAQFGDQFGMDEAAAEQILDEINWSSSMSSQQELHTILSKKSEALNDEIIDFLLQWEEMDDVSTKASTKGSKRTNVKSAGLRDTTDVLNALTLVDRELAAVDLWLGEQAERLSEIQSNLFQIEDESAALESSWQSLNVVQEVITFLINKYSLEPDQEVILTSPDKVLAALMSSASLSNLDSKLTPLLSASSALRNALLTKVNDSFGLAAAEWKQIQAIQAISSQKTKLEELSKKFCIKFGDIAAQIFDWLLKHKSCVEGEAGSCGIIPKLFTTRAVVDDIAFAMASPSGSLSITPNRFRVLKSNQLLEAQSVYHNYLSKFVPVLDILAELSPIHGRNLYQAYKSATHDRLYAPLIKAFVKDARTVVNYLQAPITFATTSRYYCNNNTNNTNDLSIYYNGSKSGASKLITSWRVFEVILFLLIPLIEVEEVFVTKLFHFEDELLDTDGTAVDNTTAAYNDANGFPKLLDMMEALFDGTMKRFTSMSSSYILNGNMNGNDGIETIALMSTLKHYMAQYQEQLFSTETTTDNTLPTHSVYVFKLFKALQETFEQRLQGFTSDQLRWISSQKADPKVSEVLLPFQRFPGLVLHVVEMCNGESFEIVEEALHKLSKELFSWLTSIAKQSDKYSEKVKITNYRYFQLSISQLNVATLQAFVAHATQQVQDSTLRYLAWMVEYEFPSLSLLAVRLDGVGGRVTDEELSLYIRRKDVLNVMKELEGKSLDTIVFNLYKRIEKHFRSDFDQELKLLSQLWVQLKDRMTNIFIKLETAASYSYQIKLDVTSMDLIKLFEKYSFQ